MIKKFQRFWSMDTEELATVALRIFLILAVSVMVSVVLIAWAGFFIWAFSGCPK